MTTSDRTRQIALAFAERRDMAHALLRQRMEERGLTETGGWKITETLRHVGSGTQLVLRPIHLRNDPPENLECVVAVHPEDDPAGDVKP
ncbi:MAG TPA: hypothetical protein VFE23_01425 [Usitatibacter sp.]|jgi:hypothetical protein|nr:hypothetical protein [Usitatibacter sp.]